MVDTAIFLGAGASKADDVPKPRETESSNSLLSITIKARRVMTASRRNTAISGL